MNRQDIFHNEDAKQHLKNGILRAAKAVEATLGPRGKTVIIKREFGPATITKDGVTVAKEIIGNTDEEDVGCSMIRSVAEVTDQNAGDGTTTASILTAYLLQETMKAVSMGANENELSDGLEMALEEVLTFFDKQAKQVTKTSKKVKDIAMISANNDEKMGELVATAFKKAGKDGIVTVQQSPNSSSYVDIVEGMRFDKGFIDSYFTNNPEKTKCVLKKPYILVTNRVIKNEDEIKPFLTLAKKNDRTLVVIAENVVDDALHSMIINKNRGILDLVAIRAPFTNETKDDFLEDIAINTGAMLFDERKGQPLVIDHIGDESKQVNVFGSCERIEVTLNHTTIIGGSGQKEAIDRRASQIRDFLDKHSSDFQAAMLRTRLAKMCANVSIIYVGGRTEEEINEKIFRVTDAYRATRSAIEEGYVPGGGVTFLKAQEALTKLISTTKLESDTKKGVTIVMESLEQPLRKMCENANEPSDVVINTIRASRKKGHGYNVKTKEYGNIEQMGIIDPKKVARVAISNAISIARTVLNSEVLIIKRDTRQGRVGLL